MKPAIVLGQGQCTVVTWTRTTSICDIIELKTDRNFWLQWERDATLISDVVDWRQLEWSEWEDIKDSFTTHCSFLSKFYVDNRSYETLTHFGTIMQSPFSLSVFPNLEVLCRLIPVSPVFAPVLQCFQALLLLFFDILEFKWQRKRTGNERTEFCVGSGGKNHSFAAILRFSFFFGGVHPITTPSTPSVLLG